MDPASEYQLRASRQTDMLTLAQSYIIAVLPLQSRRTDTHSLPSPINRFENSQSIGIDDRLREGLRRFLRQIVADAAFDGPVRILAGELVTIGCGLRVRRAIGLTFQSERRHADHRRRCQTFLQITILSLAFHQPQPLAVVIDDDSDVIRVVERRGAAVELCIIEVSFRRGDLPDQPGKIASVFIVALLPAFGGDIILAPPLKLDLRRQWHPFASSLPIR